MVEIMRVFVTLDDRLYQALQERALKRGMSFQDVINEVLTHGLTDHLPERAGGRSRRGKRAKKGSPQNPTTFEQLLDDL